jgi:hypothetical protein
MQFDVNLRLYEWENGILGQHLGYRQRRKKRYWMHFI